MANVIFKQGTLAQYNALAAKDANTLYWLSDVQRLYKGEVLYGTGAEATALASGLMSATDKAKLDALSESTVLSLSPVDSTIVIADSEGGKTIGVKISEEAGNVLSIKTDGLYAGGSDAAKVPEFAIEKQGEAVDGFSVTYKLKRTLGEEVTYVGDEINIPKDIMLKSGTMEVVAEADVPYEGAAVGDPYIDLVLNDTGATHIYIPVKGLVDTVTAGDGIAVSENTVSVKVDAANANGLAVGADGVSLSAATADAAGAMSAADKTALDTAVSDIADIKSSIVWGDLADAEETV